MYKYHLRPGYNSNKLLIEFFCGAEKDEFISDLFAAIKELKLQVLDVQDLWMNDEVILEINSENGQFNLSKDTWGFAFLMAENNQNCILKIDSILMGLEIFEKIEVDFNNYKLP